MPETRPIAFTIFGALAALGSLGVTVWLLVSPPAAGMNAPPVAGMGALGVIGGVAMATQRPALRWAGLACGVALLVLALLALGGAGGYYLPVAMLLVVMGLPAMREGR